MSAAGSAVSKSYEEMFEGNGLFSHLMSQDIQAGTTVLTTKDRHLSAVVSLRSALEGFREVSNTLTNTFPMFPGWNILVSGFHGVEISQVGPSTEFVL